MRKIDSLFRTDPEGVFSTADLCLHVYGLEAYSTAFQFPKKQRVAVIRAAHRIAKKHPGIHRWKSVARGSSWFWFHHDNVMSYSIARIRANSNLETNQDARKELSEPDLQSLITPGGSWWANVQEWIAKRDHVQLPSAKAKPAPNPPQSEKEPQASLAVFAKLFVPH
jgi:hypothetical protein